jgi:sec-independent protein translocase protein TatA
VFGLDNPVHILLLLVVLLVVFGAKRLPEMGRSLGDGMRGFKEALGGMNPDRSTATAIQAPTASSLSPFSTGEAAAPAAPAAVQEPAQPVA